MNTPPRRAADLLGLSPRILEGMYAVARHQFLAGDLGAANRSAGNYCLADSTSARAWLLLGAVRQAMGKLDEAGNMFLMALICTPNDPQPAAHAIACFRAAGLDASAAALMREWGHSIDQRDDLLSMLNGDAQ